MNMLSIGVQGLKKFFCCTMARALWGLFVGMMEGWGKGGSAGSSHGCVRGTPSLFEARISGSLCEDVNGSPIQHL